MNTISFMLLTVSTILRNLLQKLRGNGGLNCWVNSDSTVCETKFPDQFG